MLLKLHRLSHTRVHIRALMVFCALQAGDPPDCLVDYFPPSEWLLIVDESHISVPQIRGMYFGDRMRKETLVRHGVHPIMHAFVFIFFCRTLGTWGALSRMSENRTHGDLLSRT